MLEFSSDPGPLPFKTIRDEKWANRLAGVPMIIRTRVNSTMARGVALVTAVKPYDGPCPSHLAQVYGGKKLVEVYCESPPGCPGLHQPDFEWGMCARCGALMN